MENFVLNLFSDQLSKIILNYNDAKMKINANFMSGKGSITNVRLNTTLINQILTQPPYGILPFIQLKHVTLSELRLEVTSYTNLKKAPVVLVIDTVFIEAEEMMDYWFDGRHSNDVTDDDSSGASSGQPANQTKPNPKRQQYGLLHRITDNLSVRINKIHVSFQPLGKFKTRRVGKWTPPGVEVELNGVEWISVTQHGEIGTPEQIWAHNDLSAQQASMRRDAVVNSRHHHRMYTIFKRLSFLGCVRLIDSKSKGQSTLISDCKVDMHVGYTRRLRDAGITDVDVDIMCHDVDIQLDLCHINNRNGGRNTTLTGCSLESVIHLMAGLQHCMYKDRSFVDPLLSVDDPRDSSKLNEEMNDAKTTLIADGNANIDAELGPDDFMPSVNIMEDGSDSSSSDEDEEPDEEHDMAFLAWKKEQGMDSTEHQDPGEVDPNKTQSECTSSNKDTNSAPLNYMLQSTNQDKEKDEPQPKYERKRKAVIVLASGAQKFEKLSFSLTLRRVNAHLYLTRDFDCNRTHCIEMLTEGVMIECIWPKPSGEIGGNVQCSMRYLHILESLKLEDASVVRYLPLMKIGSRLFNGHDLFPSSSYCKKKSSGSVTENEMFIDDQDDGFPMMEKRQVSWKWARPMITGPSALSLKSSVSFTDEKLALWSKTFVVHEASIGEIEVCVDSDPLSRLIKATSSVPWDDRWFSGDWMDEISPDMVAKPGWTIGNHNLQPIPAWYGSASGKLSALSSELRNVTARFGGIVVRLPHPTYSFPSCGMADVVCSISSATVLVTSQLPASFLSGRIIACDGDSTRFPNGKDDLSCQDSHGLNSDAGTQFRMQITLVDFSLQVVQMPTNNINYLIAPTKITTMMSLQHTNPANDTIQITQSILVSVSVPMLESHIVVETALSGACTMHYHLTRLMCHDATDISDASSSNLIQQTTDTSEVTSVVCVHVSEISLKLATNRKQDEVLYISHVHVRRVELGVESSSNTAGTDALSVHKCVVGGFSLQSISSDIHRFTDIVSTGMETNADQSADSMAIMLRACHSSGRIFPTTSTYSLDSASPLVINLDIDAMETFKDIAIRAFNEPVYFYSRSRVCPDNYETSTQPTMIALLSLLFEPLTSLDSFQPNPNTTVLTRILLNNMTVNIPSNADGSNTDFLLTARDVDVTVGSINHTDAGPLLKHRCGRDNIIWEDIVGNDTTPGTFYAFKSRQSLMSLDSILIPEFHLDWSSAKGEDIVKKLIDTSVTIATLLSYISMKIYFMMPTMTTSKSRLTSPDKEFHSRIGHYHSTMIRLLSSAEDTIERLSLSLFSKERERLGMLAFTPSVCGWLRICEGTASFHRLFPTATLCRYWVALINSLLICYEYPGATPLSVLPISSESISLRVIAIPSAYSGTQSIVGTHLQQKGFALVDSVRSTEIFCVAADCDEFDMWVSAITDQLNQSSPAPDVASDQSQVESSPPIIPSPSEQEISSVRTEHDASTSVGGEDKHYEEENVLNAILDGGQTHPIIAEGVKSTQHIHFSEHARSDDIDMDSMDMEEISLTKSESFENTCDLSETPAGQPESILHIAQESQEVKTPTVTSTRDILKKSRFTASKFNSALKSAKSGVIAASEKGRQALEANISNHNSATVNKVDLGQKFSGLKGSASKLSTAVLTGVQDHPKVAKNVGYRADPLISSGLEALGSESQVLDFPKDLAQTNRQELMKKKLANFDQSVRRLKIDEKLNSISTAVRNVANEGQVVARQISNTGSITQLKNQQKPIKFDARETFASHSEQPVRVKSIKSGKPLIIHSDEILYQKSRLLSKIEGTWVIDVEVHEISSDTRAISESLEHNHSEASTELNDKLLFKFTSTEVGIPASLKRVLKTVSEIVVFQALLSNIFSSSSYADYAAEATYQEAIKGSSVFDRMSPLQRIGIFGITLQGVLDASNFNSPNKKCMYQSHCEMIKLFFQTLVSSDMPHDAIEATENFLEISIATYPAFETNHHNKEAKPVAGTAKKSFEEILHPRRYSSAQHQPATYDNDFQSTSSLLGIMMESYSKAIQERDQALAKLSASSILQDNMLVGPAATESAQRGSSDDQLQMLCKNLGQEIELRTAAEVQVQSLKDRLDLERTLAAAKESDLMAELDKYKSLLKKK